MKDNKRFVCKKITKDCVFPGALCKLKDIKGKFSILLENIDDAKIICDMLNLQDDLINIYKSDFREFYNKTLDYIRELAKRDCNSTVPTSKELRDKVNKYLDVWKEIFSESFFDNNVDD